MLVRNLLESPGHHLQCFPVFRSGDILEHDAAALHRPPESAVPLAIEIAEAKHEAPGCAMQQMRKSRRFFKVPGCRSDVAQDDRIVAPDQPLRADLSGK